MASGPAPIRAACPSRIQARGKFFRIDGQKWHVQGLAYGPFAPNADGHHLPDRPRLLADFEQIHQLGANALRLYHVPPPWLLDEAGRRGLKLFLDMPWEKHRCFFEDHSAQRDARLLVRNTARLLGPHPAVFAISVANEIPKDIVRYYGHRRVVRFLDDLIDLVKQESPDCLATYTNYPSTEFLELTRPDFLCFNVYLHDPHRLAAYLDRLQHRAGPLPLILGELGLDSLRHGEHHQARALSRQVQLTFRHGLAGAFVFSYTDEWFAGGANVTDWAFGLTRQDRSLKPAARTLADAWKEGLGSRVWGLGRKGMGELGNGKMGERERGRIGEDVGSASSHAPASPVKNQKSKIKNPLPLRVSIIVCSYNAGHTLEECLASLTQLHYPDYEIILVDDGSTDNTRAIAARFPAVRYLHQSNQGLSVARNVGAQAATGQIIAYTDADCAADEDWLLYLVQAMQDQDVDAIGGPNVPPPGDGWTAACVAASPGSPSHVMLDDRRAEHLPGCNMAFRREKLLALGGFDPRFRQAGDDVDLCWRMLDAGLRLGYAPAALIWHHRRPTLSGYLKQQAGYGRAEAMLRVKHPHRFGQLGWAHWNGIIYGDGALGLATAPPQIHHGRFGMGLFQRVYQSSTPSPWACFVLLEWHLLALYVLFLSWMFPPLAILSLAMWGTTLAAAFRSCRAPLPRSAPRWCRPVVFALHLLQPLVRAAHRLAHRYRVAGRKLPHVPVDDRPSESHIMRLEPSTWDLYWSSEQARGREDLLAALQSEAQRTAFEVNFESDWKTWDAWITGDALHDITLHTATEELGHPRRFTRARCHTRPTALAIALCFATVLWTALAAATQHFAPALLALLASPLLLWEFRASRRRCLQAVSRLLWRAGHHAKLDIVSLATVSLETLEFRPLPPTPRPLPPLLPDA